MVVNLYTQLDLDVVKTASGVELFANFMSLCLLKVIKLKCQ